MNDNKKKLSAGKIVKTIISVAVVAAIVYAILYFIFGIGIDIKLPQKKSKGLTDQAYFSEEEMEKQLSAEKSDIDGMTKYDKLDMGLCTDDGADSDMDGLTDKEEIEKYHTDPTKASTSGDMYPDGYKVAHDMDLTKKYDYKDDLNFPDNACNEVCLEAKSARDFNAFVSDLTGTSMYNIQDNKNVIKEYSVCLYSGKFGIDLSKIEKAPDADSVNVYVQEDGANSAKGVKFEIEGDVITLSKAFEYDQHYIIYLVDEKPSVISFFDKATITYGSLDENGEPERSYGIVCGSPLDSDSLNIYYMETTDKVTGERARDALIPIAEDLATEIWCDGEHHFDEKNIHATTKDEVDKYAKKAERSVLCRKYEKKEGHLTKYGLLYTYYIYDEGGSITYVGNENTDSGSEDSANSIKYFDMLPFSNFGTEMSPNGVCAGIAHLTSIVHNKGGVPDLVKEFSYKDKTYSYDITDQDNKTLLDRGLHDYKDANFVKDHKDSNGLVTKNLTDSEQSFVNMVGYYWAVENNAAQNWKYIKGIDSSDDDDITSRLFYDGTIVRNIVKEMDDGNFVDACFILNDGSGHTVNLTGYKKINTDKTDGYIFYVYDSNSPNKTGTLTCEINTRSDGREFLNYSLYVPGMDYTAHSGSSYKTKSGKRISSFIAVDDEFNVLNEE